MIKTYKDLDIFKGSYKLSLYIYKITAKYPKDEIYGITGSEVSLSNGYITCHSILYSIDGTQITTVTKAE